MCMFHPPSLTGGLCSPCFHLCTLQETFLSESVSTCVAKCILVFLLFSIFEVNCLLPPSLGHSSLVSMPALTPGFPPICKLLLLYHLRWLLLHMTSKLWSSSGLFSALSLQCDLVASNAGCVAFLTVCRQPRDVPFDIFSPTSHMLSTLKASVAEFLSFSSYLFPPLSLIIHALIQPSIPRFVLHYPLPLKFPEAFNPWPAGCTWPRLAMNAAPHKVTNVLKTFFCSSVFVSVCVFNVWPKTALLLSVWPRDTKRLDTPALNHQQILCPK